MKKLSPKHICLTLATMLTFSAAAQGIFPTNLQCEAKSNPIGLSETSPRLSWQDMTSVAGARGQYQTAYQIQVASSPQLLTGNQGDLWDTGQVATNQNSQIAYAGSALTMDQVYYWHVRVWDGNGQPSAWSPSASWSMGMLITTNIVVQAGVAEGTFTSDSVLALAGAVSNEVYGVDFGGSGAQTTANGYTFADYGTSGNMSIAGSPSSFGGFMTGGATTGDAALNSILTHGLYGGPGNTGTLNNLTVGQAYTVLVLLADTRGATAGGSPTFTVTDGGTTSPSQQFEFANGTPSVGGYIMGTFTATATTQALTVNNGPGGSLYIAILLEKGVATNALFYTNIVMQSQWTGQWIGRDDAPAYNSNGTTNVATFPQANWIWFPEGNPAVSAPAATRWFRKTFTVPAGTSAAIAIATMTADNSFTLYVNGQIVLNGTNWNQTYQTDVSSLLVSGTNVLAVAAVNGGTSPNPAGLIGSFDLKFSNGQTNSFQTDGTWLTTNQLVANWNQTNFVATGWANALVLGAYGISPWGNFTTIKSYWAATYLRKDFTLAQLPARAVLYVTGLGNVEAHLNGSKVGSEYFTPGWTDYNQRVYYRTFDVTSMLRSGSNTLGAILGDGWFRGNISVLGQNFYGTKTRLSAELHLFYANGTTQIIASDPTWKGGFGPILEGDMFDGETYDARLEMPGWDSPGYTNAAWTSVTTGAQVSPAIQAYPEEPVQVQRQIAPITITNPQAGVYVINYGQSFAGWVRLQVNEPAGTHVVMQFGEWLNPDGTVYQGNYRTAKATDTYICKGGGTETWEPRFTYRAYQYVQITGLTQPPTINTMTGIVVNSSLPEVGSFQCSNGQINQMWSNMLWSLRTAYFDIPSAAQERDERMGWSDGIEIMRSGMFAMQTESFFSKWYQDIVDGKTSPTTFPQMAPTPWNFGFSSGWADCAVEVPYWLYQTYGDKRVAQRFYGQMQDHLEYYAANSSNFIGPNGGYGDWEAIDASTPLNLVSTAFYAGCANEMAQMAQVLGNTSDAATYRQLFTNICAAFQSNFVTGNGTVGSGSEGSYVLALYYNLLTPAQRMLAGSNLVAAINAAGGNPTTGMVTTHMLLPVLTSIGRSDVAYQMLAKTNYPSWGYQIKLGATSYWELWNSVNADGTFNTSEAGMNSLNIPNFGTIAEWFYRGILGIDLLQPGFKQILIAPQIGGGLTSAQGSYNSIQGLITSAWQLTNNTLKLNVTIPANATAQINVPTTYANAITESGVPAASSPGVTYVGVSNSIVAGVSTNTYAIYSVGSGNYVFSSPFLIPVPPTITMTNQTGSGSGTFYPSWTVVTNGSLIAGQAPSTALGNFSLEASGRSVNSLTTGTDLGITLINGVTTSTNYVTCGNSGGAGSTIIYTLTGPTNGYDLTNITVYGGWANNGRDQQAYTIYYSTVSAPTNFISLAVVNYDPSIGSGIQSATRVTLTSTNGVLAGNVAAVKFDFTSPTTPNGYCGYAAITIFGTANVAPPIPAILGATMTANYLVLNFGSLVVGRNYTLQSTTNLASGVWSTEINFMAAQSASVFTNFFINGAQKFYRVVGY